MYKNWICQKNKNNLECIKIGCINKQEKTLNEFKLDVLKNHNNLECIKIECVKKKKTLNV